MKDARFTGSLKSTRFKGISILPLDLLSRVRGCIFTIWRPSRRKTRSGYLRLIQVLRFDLGN
jgi:hypothetical protein